MKIKIKNYPITATSETKTAKSGKSYDAIGIGRTEKDKDGNYKTTWLNFIDKKDLLVMAQTCETLYQKMSEEDKPNQQNDSDDVIPF